MNPDNPVPPTPVQPPTPDILPTGVTVEQPSTTPTPTVPPVTPPEPPKPINKTILILIVILAFVGLGVLGYWAYQSYFTSPKPITEVSTPTPIATTDPTASWKTFTHPTNKYQFKYPSEWTTAINEKAKAGVLFGPNASSSSGIGGVEVREINIEPQDFYKLTESKVIESTPYSINGINGYKYTYSNIMVSHGFVFKNTDGLIYNIYINTDDKQNLEIFDQILSTFKFTDQTTDLSTLSWIPKEWYIAGNFEEFPIPNATYRIEYPSTWNYSNNSDTAKKCFKIAVTDPTKTITVGVDAICTGWAATNDKVSLPNDYKLVKKSEGVLNGEPSFEYLVRIKKISGDYTYIQGQSSKDDIQSAFFTNAVMIEENTSTKDTHSYFTASNILVKYSGTPELKEKYLEIADRIIASLVIKSVNYEK